MAQTIVLEQELEPYPGCMISKLIGRGGFGEVWEGIEESGRRVALKFIPFDGKHMALRELRALQSYRNLHHNRLIQIERIWTFGGYLVIEMELAGGSLVDLHEEYQRELQRTIPPEILCLLVLDAAAGLDFLNTRQHCINGNCVAIVHGDVKPSNLLLVDDRVKVADFGLSHCLGSPSERRHRCGTLEFCPPEMFLGIVTNSSDQYALAMTYYYLRTGRAPLPGKAEGFDAKYVRPQADLDLLDQAERPIVSRGLDPVHQHRWPSCTEFARRLWRLFS